MMDDDTIGNFETMIVPRELGFDFILCVSVCAHAFRKKCGIAINT